MKQNARCYVFMTVAKQICILDKCGVSLSCECKLKLAQTKRVSEGGGGGGGEGVILATADVAKRELGH